MPIKKNFLTKPLKQYCLISLFGKLFQSCVVDKTLRELIGIILSQYKSLIILLGCEKSNANRILKM